MEGEAEIRNQEVKQESGTRQELGVTEELRGDPEQSNKLPELPGKAEVRKGKVKVHLG